MAKKKACMICGKERGGTDVEEDHVIRAMRWFKTNITRNAKGYRIVVCKDCMPEYKRLRGKFVRRRAIYVALGVVFTVAVVAISGDRWLGAVGYGLVIVLFLYGLSLVSYMPALKGSQELGEGKRK